MHEQLRNGLIAEELRGGSALGGDSELAASLLRGLDKVRKSG